MADGEAAAQRRRIARHLPHRAAAALAVPAIASNVAVPLAGLVDTAALGHFATATDLGAVGLGAAVISTLFWIFSFLRVGTTSLVGRSLGRGDRAGAVRHIQRAAALAGAMAAAWLVLMWVLVPGILHLLAPDGPARDAALAYTLIRGLSLPALLVTLVVTGYFIGAKNTRIPLLIASTQAVANIVLDLLLVGGFGMGAAGAAWGTFGSEWIGAALAVAMLWRHLDARQRATVRDWRDATLRTGWNALLRFNGALMARTALLTGVVTFVASIGAHFGPEVLAANAIMLQMMHVASYALDGYANAAETLVAHAAGAGEVPQFHAAVIATAIPMAAIGVILSCAYWFARSGILDALTDLPGVQSTALEYWPWIALLPVLSWGAYWLDGVFLGAGQSPLMLGAMALSVLGVFVPVILWGTQQPGGLTNATVWTAFVALNVVRVVTLGAVYSRLTSTVARAA
ncbi:MATE family efflux transporter [Demequina activiva]|uniref:Probable multidrug resistance protein NorM n=1 Tax=Demequina activiva TaxID=1582364 RepID=A0A919Q5Y2_9MICO|nr:MATE family efflux transporter [Demequina activiva]GIG55133.1 MATE family efflux transporter [Demequina activiva]